MKYKHKEVHAYPLGSSNNSYNLFIGYRRYIEVIGGLGSRLCCIDERHTTTYYMNNRRSFVCIHVTSITTNRSKYI